MKAPAAEQRSQLRPRSSLQLGARTSSSALSAKREQKRPQTRDETGANLVRCADGTSALPAKDSPLGLTLVAAPQLWNLL